jgi:hypothetical protein
MATNIAGKALPAGNGGVTYPSPNEWPTTYHAITAINKSPQAQITAPAHGITMSLTTSTPKVDFTQVKGMTQINGQFAFVTSVIDADNITVALDTSTYFAYTSGGFLNVTGGSTPIDPLTNIA